MNKLNLGSWKTSMGGVVALILFIFVGLKVWNSYLTGEPVDIDTLISGGLALANAITAFAARDNNVSSQDVGIR